jgi:uncharacterized protein YcnI
VRRALVAAATVAALALPTTAPAHVVLVPPFVQVGDEVLVSLLAPNERPPNATIELVASAPPGIDIVFANAPPGWQATVDGNTATWRGGRIGGREIVSFPIRIVARVRAGTYTFKTAQRYDDGATVRWKVDLSVLPATGAAAPKQHPWSAVAAALAGIVVIAGSLVGLRFLRRRPLQDP